MKKTNNVGLIFLTILIVSIGATSLFELLSIHYGAGTVFVGMVCLLPICLAWALIQDYLIKRKKRSKEL